MQVLLHWMPTRLLTSMPLKKVEGSSRFLFRGEGQNHKTNCLLTSYLPLQMKPYLLIVLFPFFVSCHSKESAKILDSTSWQHLSVKLENSPNVISIALPKRFDTMLVWEAHKYRWQPKSLPVNLESNFYDSSLIGNIDQLTIVYSPYRDTSKIPSLVKLKKAH